MRVVIYLLLLIFSFNLCWADNIGWEVGATYPNNDFYIDLQASDGYSIYIDAKAPLKYTCTVAGNPSNATFMGEKAAYKGYPDSQWRGRYYGRTYLYANKTYEDKLISIIAGNSEYWLDIHSYENATQWYLQGQAPWGSKKYGIDDPQGRLMADIGCCCTMYAMLLSQCGVPTDPGQLNAWLQTHSGYARGKKSSGKVNVLPNKVVAYARSRGHSVVFKRGVPVKEALTRGLATGMTVKNGGHFVVAYARSSNPDGIRIYDPMGRTTNSTGYSGVGEGDTRCLYEGGSSVKGYSSSMLNVNALTPDSSESLLGNSTINACVDDEQIIISLLSNGGAVLATSEINVIEDANGVISQEGSTLEYTQVNRGNYILRIVGPVGRSYNIELREYDLDNDEKFQILTGVIPASGSIDIPFFHETPVGFSAPTSLKSLTVGSTIFFDTGFLTANVPGGFIVQAERIPAVYVEWSSPITPGCKTTKIIGTVAVKADGTKYLKATYVEYMYWFTGSPKLTFTSLEYLNSTFNTLVKTIGTVTSKTAGGFVLDNKVTVVSTLAPLVGDKKVFTGVFYQSKFYVSDMDYLPEYW